jgi:hypothetical protein
MGFTIYKWSVCTTLELFTVEDRGKHPAEWFYRTGFLYIPIESELKTNDSF